MKKRTKTAKSTYKIKAGVSCPSCKDEIFSFYRNDFRRCVCGKVFVDGGDLCLFGAEPCVDIEDVKRVYRPYDVAERSMSREVRDRMPMAPPPLSFFTDRKRYQVIWNWSSWNWPSRLGEYPKLPERYAGSIYKWIVVAGPVEIRRWS